jgi:nucleotide-binding universal stress UspA family protein
MVAMAARARTIVVAYDDTDTARRALDVAAGLVGYGSTLTVLSAKQNGSSAALLSEARERLLRRQLPARYLATNDEIVEVARELAADLLVVGRPVAGESSDGGLDAVVHGAPCDLLVVT